MLKLNFQSITHPDDLQLSIDNMKRLIEGQIRCFNMDKRYYRADGSIVWVSLTVVPMWGQSESPRYHIAMVEDITERKQAEEALRESEERFRTLAASVPVGIFQTDAEGKIEYVNQRVLKITGLTALEETADWRWGIDPHPDDREAVIAERTKAIAEGRTFLGDFRILTPQSVTRWVETRTCSLFNEKGGQIGHAGMVEDVTQRRQAEEALRESEELFRTLYESSRDGIAAADLDGYFTGCNRAYADMLGYSREELQRIRYQDITPSKWHALNADGVRQAMERGYSEEFEKEYIKKDGTVFPVSLRVWRIEDEAGRPVGVWTIVRDITKRKQAEEALRESERRFRQVLEVSSDLVYKLDLESGTFDYVSPSARPLTGFTPEEVIAMGFPGIRLRIHPEDWPRYKREINEFVETNSRDGATRRYEYRWRCKDDQYRWFEESRALVRGEDLPPLAVVGTIRDTTERKQAEEELQESEQRFRSVLDVSLDFIYKIDLRTGTYDYASPYVLELTGFTPEEVVALGLRGVSERVHPEDGERLTEKMKDLTKDWGEGHRNALSVYRWKRKDGEYRWFSDNSVFIRYSNEQPATLIGAVRDITAEKQAEEALRESERRFRRVLELSSDLIYRLDLESRTYDYVSPSVLRLSGFTENEFAALGIHGIRHRVHPEDWPEFKRKLEEALQPRSDDGEARGHEYRWQCKDGQYRWFHESVAFVRGNDGRPLALVGTVRDITERKQAGEALQESVRLLRDTGEMAKVGGWELDISTKEVSWTEEVRRIHGVEPGYKPKLEEALDFYAPESRPAVEAAVKKALETGEPYDLESLFIPLGSKDKIWVRSLGKAVYSGGKIVKLAGTFQNTDKHKRAEEALRESEGRFRQVLEAASDAICRVSVPSGVCEYVSPAFLPLTGFTQEEFAALGVYAYRHRIHPDDWPQYRQRVEKLVAGFEDETASRHEYRWLCKNGQYRWFADSVALVRDDDGRPLALVFTGRDTTERREAEEVLRESEERFRTLAASVPVGIFLTDAEGKIVYVNQTVLEITGLTALKDTAGWRWGIDPHPDDREAVIAERTKAMAEGRAFLGDFRVLTPQGVTRCVETRNSPLFDEKGEQIGRAGIVEDVTERRQAEERERRLHEQEAHTRELRAAVHALERMAATLGHELRNPLGVISNSAYFLCNQAGISDARALKHAEIIGREVKSARRAIDDILEFAHTPQILLSPASLNVIVDQALARSQIPTNIRLTRRPAPDLPPLVCDAERLERSFINVIANAVQAMPHGGRLSVRTQLAADGVTMVFCDTGEGIAPQNLAKVFDPMFTTKLRGIGLGLTVVRRTAEQHGGQVELKSKLGRGTSVIMTLPLAPIASASGNSVPADAPGSAAQS
jgi:PAS domain S-box-containing protein